MPTKLLPSRGPKSGQSGYIIPYVSEVPNAQRGDKIRSCYLAPADSGAQKWVKWLHQPCHLRVPYSQRGDKIKSGNLIPAVSRAQKWAKWLHPCHLGVPNAQHRTEKRLPNPCHLGGPKVGKVATSPLPSRGPQSSVWGQNQKWLPNPCRLSKPRQPKGTSMRPVERIRLGGIPANPTICSAAAMSTTCVDRISLTAISPCTDRRNRSGLGVPKNKLPSNMSKE